MYFVVNLALFFLFQQPLLEIFQKRTESTPIYYDPREDDYYYPDISSYEFENFNRQIITNPEPPLTFDPIMNLYRDYKGEPYEKYKFPQDFFRLRSGRVDLRLLRRKQIQNLPIYNDPITDHYFYPISAFEETETTESETIRTKPPLIYDLDLFGFIHTENGEEYMELGSKQEYLWLKEDLLRYLEISKVELEEPEFVEEEVVDENGSKVLGVQLEYDKKDLGDAKLIKDCEDLAYETPIYHFDNVYYYPVVALKEHIPTQRVVLDTKPPLTLDPNSQTFFHIITGEEYLEFKDEKAFKVGRKAADKQPLTDIIQDRISKTPIFLFQNEYYYPVTALYEINEIPRIVEKVDELPLSGSGNEWVNNDGVRYLKFTSYGEFKGKRSGVLEKRGEFRMKHVAKATPIFMTDEGKFWYPIEAFEERQVVEREILRGEPGKLYRVISKNDKCLPTRYLSCFRKSI